MIAFIVVFLYDYFVGLYFGFSPYVIANLEILELKEKTMVDYQ